MEGKVIHKNKNEWTPCRGREGGAEMPRKIQPLTAQQELFVRLSAQGQSRDTIMREVFHLDLATSPENEIHNADAKMYRWRRHPDYESTWKREVKDILYGVTSEAIQVVRGQLRRDDQPWLQNKAANDLLNYGKSQIYGDEERAVHVKIEGMPEIGSPDDD